MLSHMLKPVIASLLLRPRGFATVVTTGVKLHKIGLLPADGIGREVVPVSRSKLEKSLT